jgi:hypothetical protein
VLNVNQVLLPTVSVDPDMPISEDYMHDMSPVQAYMLDHARPGDALISTVYGLYATWEQQPGFAAQYRINAGTTSAELVALVAGYPSGWIVIDSIRLDLSALSVREVTSLPQMEYIGTFGDEHVWRWGRQAAATEAPTL